MILAIKKNTKKYEIRDGVKGKMLAKNENSISCMRRLGYAFCIIIALIFLNAPARADQLYSYNNSCVNCHKSLSPFTDEQIRFNDIRLNHTQRNISCSLECHEDIIRKKATDNFQQWSESAHSKYYVTCDACHGGNPNGNTEAEAHSSMKNISDPESSIYFKNIPETCGKCHAEELHHFKNTMHYQRLRAESQAPSCVTCHQPHGFKVLKASELTPLCSVCHNQRDQIANANVPKDATLALEKANELQERIDKVSNAISEAKANGKDIGSAQNDLDKAMSVMKDIPFQWHSFNLEDFDKQTQIGIEYAKNAEDKLSGVEPTVPSVPGLGVPMIIGVLAALYFIRKYVK